MSICSLFIKKYLNFKEKIIFVQPSSTKMDPFLVLKKYLLGIKGSRWTLLFNQIFLLLPKKEKMKIVSIAGRS